ncbi:HNH endonuclease [Tsukamurella tyrosinosolvens]|uniref:HNH endonuclease n=1 Tax=Tsukamurella tyrosinosolvens TaxID=57704 RepID=UPI001CE08B69|nr:HNH endonuclease [Tsukamurella tyrosinosolvens]
MAWPNGGDSRTSTPQWRRIRTQCIARDGNQCSRCGADGTYTPLECDHIINVARGGTDTLDNATMLCGPCHATKTRDESVAGLRARAARGRHPSDKHPGLL